jgi:hypothetical protein
MRHSARVGKVKSLNPQSQVSPALNAILQQQRDARNAKHPGTRSTRREEKDGSALQAAGRAVSESLRQGLRPEPCLNFIRGDEKGGLHPWFDFRRRPSNLSVRYPSDSLRTPADVKGQVQTRACI